MKPTENSLLPLEDAREAALFFVVGALCFLAALAALSAKSTYGAARTWTAQVEGEYTVSLSGADATAADEAARLLSGLDGVITARAFSDAEINALLEPNFGKSGLPADLPVPRLIAVTGAADAEDLGARISTALPSPKLFTPDTTSSTVWRRTSLPVTGEWVRPTRANKSLRWS